MIADVDDAADGTRLGGGGNVAAGTSFQPPFSRCSGGGGTIDGAWVSGIKFGIPAGGAPIIGGGGGACITGGAVFV